MTSTVRTTEFSIEELQRSARQADWRAKSIEKLRASRTRRLERLMTQEASIRRAVDVYRELDLGDVPWIRIRQQFVRLDEPRDMARIKMSSGAARQRLDLESRPPLTRLINRKSHALALYMTAAYLAHIELQSRQSFVSDRRNATLKGKIQPWSVVLGVHAPGENRVSRARIVRALDELRVTRLVVFPRTAQPNDSYNGWRLLSDDDSGRIYRVPGEDYRRVIRLPAHFFYNGWHLVMEPTELAMLLAVLDMTNRISYRGRKKTDGVGVALPTSVREDFYGISGETYTHVHELEEFGLMELHDPMPHRRGGKISSGSAGQAELPGTKDSPAPEPYRFVPRDAGYEDDALDVVTRALRESPVPYRLNEAYGLVAPPVVRKGNLPLNTRRA
jgi:hypothetical protein